MPASNPGTAPPLSRTRISTDVSRTVSQWSAHTAACVLLRSVGSDSAAVPEQSSVTPLVPAATVKTTMLKEAALCLPIISHQLPTELRTLSAVSIPELRTLLQEHLQAVVTRQHRQVCAAAAGLAAAQARAQSAESRAAAAQESQAVLSRANAALHAQHDAQVGPLAVVCCD